jgi:dipeptidyl-peptidase-2
MIFYSDKIAIHLFFFVEHGQDQIWTVNNNYSHWQLYNFYLLRLFYYKHRETHVEEKERTKNVKYACMMINWSSCSLSGCLGIFYPMDQSPSGPCHNITADFIECADPTGCGVGPNALAWDYQVSLLFPIKIQSRTDGDPP